jgi:ankyrin repeat protein
MLKKPVICRRAAVGGVLSVSLGAMIAGCSRENTMSDQLWHQWQQNWRWMEALAKSRQWDVSPLRIAPPATETEIAVFEARHGMKVPAQLRELLRRYSRHVAFGWDIPNHLQPMEQQRLPDSSANRGAIWDLGHIEQYALPNFAALKRDLAAKDISEAPNRPELWEKQFPFYWLPNGDVLTIDMKLTDGTQQPVRYFSHQTEMIHGLALAPDFFTYMTEMSKLGHAGSEWWSMMPFGDHQTNDTLYLRADSRGGKAWLAWLAKDPAAVAADEPPLTIVETSQADRALLLAARSNSIAGVSAALASGAQPNCVFKSEWRLETMAFDEEYHTAITYAVRYNNTDMIERLLMAGATLNTRRLPLNEAVKSSSLETVEWLIAKGARVNGWNGQRYWPLHDLVVTRGVEAAMTKDEYAQSIKENGWPTEPSEIADKLARHIDGATYDKMLEALLKAGAQPDAPWDNGLTMLMWGGVATAQQLLKFGANPNARNVHGWTALHAPRTPDKVRLLVAHGADIDARATPPTADGSRPATPLQFALADSRTNGLAWTKTFLELGADPHRTDGAGRTSLAYCFNVAAFKLMQSYGLDPKALLPGRQTLLHNLVTMSHAPRATFPEEIAFLDFLLGFGLDINARDDQGRTLLHYPAEREGYPEAAPNYTLLLKRGADPSIQDNSGKYPYDLVAKSLGKIRTVLKPK